MHLILASERGVCGSRWRKSWDSIIAMAYAMLAAESLGLGSCCIGMAVALNHYAHLRLRYRIPEKSAVAGMLAIGHPAVKFHRSVRRRCASVESV